eukprot:m.200410 g.200410  ORF g.200410 m.200410 type:complete len:97 (-) comp21044_c0_seq1:39-329(-)
MYACKPQHVTIDQVKVKSMTRLPCSHDPLLSTMTATLQPFLPPSEYNRYTKQKHSKYLDSDWTEETEYPRTSFPLGRRELLAHLRECVSSKMTSYA